MEQGPVCSYVPSAFLGIFKSSGKPIPEISTEGSVLCTGWSVGSTGFCVLGPALSSALPEDWRPLSHTPSPKLPLKSSPIGRWNSVFLPLYSDILLYLFFPSARLSGGSWLHLTLLLGYESLYCRDSINHHFSSLVSSCPLSTLSPVIARCSVKEGRTG